MAEENLVDDALARAAARGFEFALQLMDGLANPSRDAVIDRLLEVARGETVLYSAMDELVTIETSRGGPLPPTERRRRIDEMTRPCRALNDETRATAHRIADIILR